MSTLDQDLMKQLLNTFRSESTEHLETINQSLLQIERAPEEKQRQKLVQDAFRAAHSLKGAARAVSLQEVESLAHAMESVLQQARDKGVPLEADTCDVLYEAVDAIGALVSGKNVNSASLRQRLEAVVGADAVEPVENLPESRPLPEAASVPSIGEDTIRVSVAKLDNLMAQVGELLVSKINAEQRQMDGNQIGYQIDQWDIVWRELKAVIPHLDGDSGRRVNDILSRHSEQMQMLGQKFAKFRQDINRDSVRLGMVTSDLQDRVRHVRMVPFQALVLGLERAVRDAARASGKHVSFQVVGADVELDKKILETLKDALLHLLRNAVSHGIETPDERKAVGKSPEGSVTLTVHQRGSEVRMSIKDNGSGFDLENLRRVAIERGTAVTENATDDDIISLAFLPGISTAKALTTFSGRGVGLDIVRQSLEDVQGRISIRNQPGEGVTIDLIVPTTLAMTRGLMVRVGKERYVLPLQSIESIATPKDVLYVGGKPMLTVAGTPLPLVSLAAVLQRGISHEKDVSDRFVIIMTVADQRLAILVDEVLTEQEMAVKALGRPLTRVRNVAGAALLGNGEPIVVLNPADLVRSASRSHTQGVYDVHTPHEEDSRRSVHILVVDDSITTRTLEKNILEAAGYLVTTATHGLEALKRLEENAIDVIVSDIQMPHMNGFELTTHLRDHDEFSRLPIILVTSLESREDRERGMIAGADAYIVKRGFDQAELLATIQKYL